MQNSFENRNNSMMMKIIILMFVLILCIFSLQASDDNDSELIDKMISSKGNNIIVFDHKNIKQFWINTTVVSQKDSFTIQLSQISDPYRIQLANVNELQKCKIEIITDNSDVSFQIFNSQMKLLSSSEQTEDFLHYHILSSSFNIEDTEDYIVYLRFISNVRELTLRKVVLSFSNNETSSYLVSPGELIMSDNNSSVFANNYSFEDYKVLSASGNRIYWKSTKKLLVSDNEFVSKVTVSNVGKVAAKVYVGYSPYQKNHKRIDNCCVPYKNDNTILSVVFSQEKSNDIIVDSMTDWKEGCFLVSGAKDDLSDFPNYSIVGRISKLERNNDNQVVITLSAPVENKLLKGTPLRIQSSYGYSDLFVNILELKPGDKQTLIYSIKKNDNYYKYDRKALCKGTYYIVPVIDIRSIDNSSEVNVKVSDFIVSF